MSYEVSWLVDRRVLYVRLYGSHSSEEIRRLAAETRELCEEGLPFVHIISDTTEQLRAEFKMQDILNMFRGAPPPIAKVGWSTYVSLNPVNRFLFSITSQLTSGKHRAFVTLEDAIAFLQQVDHTLPSIPVPEKMAHI